MTNAPCTPASPEEKAFLLDAFPLCLSEEEEAVGRNFFKPFVFFRKAEENNVRRCVCTSCMEGFFVHKETSPAFFRATHGKRCECPECGQAATLLAMGKYLNFNSLDACERAVWVSARGGWLLVQAGYLRRYFTYDDLGGYLDFEPARRYAFAPGRRLMWSAEHGAWEEKPSVREPFVPRPYEREAAYILLGAEALGVGPMQYNGYAAWFEREFGAGLEDLDQEPVRVAWLARYLAEYTRFPQIEMLEKLGYHEAVSDLVIRKRAHRDILDWTARNPADFFRLSRRDFRQFAQDGGSFVDLKLFRKMQKARLVEDLRQFEAERAASGTDFAGLCRCCLLAGVTPERGRRYLRGLPEGRDALRLWLDYLTAARTLRYDLSRDDVRLPKDLTARHDDACAAASIVSDEKTRRAMKARHAALCGQFAFEADGLCVRVPASVQEIVEEGKALRHCVGGYAERHLRGAVTILFLRKCQNPDAPYVTMELTTHRNCEDLRMVQIHGFQNDRGAKVPPEERHAGFLARWMEWVHGGSPRDENGMPVLPERKGARSA